MRTGFFRIAIVTGVMLGLTLLAPSPSQAQPGYSFFVQLGVQGVDLNDRPAAAKFEEYRDVPDGFVLQELRFGWRSEESPWAFDLKGIDLGQDDEHVGLTLDKAASLRFKASWDRTPHLFSRNAVVIHTIDGGNLLLNPAVRSVLEANPARMPEILSQIGRPFEVGLRRDTGKAALDYRLLDSLDLRMGVQHQERHGTSRISNGTYIRKTTVEPGTGANSFDRERFEPRGFEMPQPVDYRSTDYGVSSTFHRRAGFFTVGIDGSAFSNHIATLSWDNPFEAAPSVSSSGADKGRFARGAIDLWPDNTYERFHAAGGLNLPGGTRVQVNYARGTMEQDDSFLPFTQNEALFFPGADGKLGTSDDVPGTSLSLLPAASLDGKVETTRADVRVSTNPVEPLHLRAAWRSYKYDDKTRELIFPGYAAFGESAWRVGIGLKLNGVEKLFNEAGGYDREVWSVGGSYRFGRPALLDVEFTNTDWSYDRRQVKGTSEDTVQARLRLTPVDWLEASLSWLDASRDFDGPYDVGLETSRIRAFDVWNRDRTRYGAEVDFMPGESWTLGLAFSNWKDQYPGVVPIPSPASTSNPYPSYPYGLNEAVNDSLSLSWSYLAERWTLSGSLGRDTSEWVSLATSKTTLATDTVLYDPNNRWRRVQDDSLDWANLALEAQLVPDRIRLLAEMDWSSYKGDMKTTNPGVPNIDSAAAYPFPSFKTELFSGDVALRWSVARNTEIEARYLYEPFRMDDFMWDAVQPWMQGVVQETGGSPSQIRDSDVRRFLFLDSTYSNYTAQVYSLSLRWKH
jgi:MtrB/PioB family decaheme-associated outer membrane protein